MAPNSKERTMSGFDEILSQLEQEGRLSTIEVERLRDASPLRKELETYKTRTTELEESNRTLTQRLSRDVFSQAGIALDPSLLRTPDDLDVTDVNAVKNWALEQKLIEEKPATDPAVVDAHQRIADAATASPAGGTDEASILAQLDPRTMDEEAFWKQAEALGRTT